MGFGRQYSYEAIDIFAPPPYSCLIQESRESHYALCAGSEGIGDTDYVLQYLNVATHWCCTILRRRSP